MVIARVSNATAKNVSAMRERRVTLRAANTRTKHNFGEQYLLFMNRGISTVTLLCSSEKQPRSPAHLQLGAPPRVEHKTALRASFIIVQEENSASEKKAGDARPPKAANRSGGVRAKEQTCDATELDQ
jgi:hypothetical protein